MLEVFTTVGSEKEAEQMARVLVVEKLAACVNYWRVSSIYRWKGKIHSSREWMLCVKTLEKNEKKVEKKLRELHSYKLPVITMVKVKANQTAEKWVKTCT